MYKIGSKFYDPEHEAIIVIDGVCSNPNMYICNTYEIENHKFELTVSWIFSKSELESMISMEGIE